MLYPGTQPEAHLLFSTDTLALPFVYIIILEIMESKEVKRVPESRKYAESAAAAEAVVRKSFLSIRFLSIRAKTEVKHTAKLLQQPEPQLSLFSPFTGLAPVYARITLQRADSPKSWGYLAR